MTGLFLIKLVYFKLIMSAFSKSYFSVSLENVLKKTLHFNGEILRPVTGYKAVWLTFQPWSRHPLSASPLGPRPGFLSSVVFSLLNGPQSFQTLQSETWVSISSTPSSFSRSANQQPDPVNSTTPIPGSSLTMSATLMKDNLQ